MTNEKQMSKDVDDSMLQQDRGWTTPIVTTNEEQIEQMIQDKGLTAPRVTPKTLDEAMSAAEIQYYQFPGTTVTVCCAELANGYCLIGKSAAVSPENFDTYVGREVAYKDAREQLWGLLGFKLKADMMKPSVVVGE